MNLLIKNFPDDTQAELKIMAIKKSLSVARLITLILINEVLKEKNDTNKKNK